MALIFAVQGEEQRGPRLAELPWVVCRELFEIDDMSATEERPKFGSGATIFPTRMVIQIDDAEGQQYGLRACWFVSPLPFEEAKRNLDAYLSSH